MQNQNSGSIIPKTPQSFGEVISTGWEYCTQAYTRILPISFLYSLVSVAPSLIFPEHPVHSVAQGNTDQAVIQADQYQSMGLLGAVLGLVFASLTLILYAAFIYRLNSIVEGHDVGFGASLGRGTRKLLPLWGLAIMYGIFMIIGLILLIIPGIYVSILLYFSFYVMILRNLGVFASFKQCMALVKGYWWRTFLLTFGMGIVMIILAVLISLPLLDYNVPRILALLVFQTIALPVVVGILLAYYLDLEARLQLKPVTKSEEK